MDELMVVKMVHSRENNLAARMVVMKAVHSVVTRAEWTVGKKVPWLAVVMDMH